MKQRILVLFLALFSCTTSLQAGLWHSVKGYFEENKGSAPPTIRILIAHDIEESNLEVKGQYSLINPYTGEHISNRYIGKSKTIQGLGDGLNWGESFPGLYQLKIQPRNEQTVTLVDHLPFQGNVYVYDVGKTISIVNEITVEEYIKAILSQYQDKQWEEETLFALAIVARTNAYFQTVSPQNQFWSVDADRVGFKGITTTSSSIDEAIYNTRFMILSRTGVYEKVVTPFPAQFDGLFLGLSSKEATMSKITLDEANEMAKKGEHAAQILAKAYPNTTIMLINHNQNRSFFAP